MRLKFTPRRTGSDWSELNRRRVRKLIKEGRMTKAGLAKIVPAAMRKPVRRKPVVSNVVPPYMKQALMEEESAWEDFTALAPSHRKAYILWISLAKKQETRERRLKEAIGLLKQKRKLGLK